ncbi:MAG: hypothetical protein ABIC19_00305 [Patescibacteria group bacterium]
MKKFFLFFCFLFLFTTGAAAAGGPAPSADEPFVRFKADTGGIDILLSALAERRIVDKFGQIYPPEFIEEVISFVEITSSPASFPPPSFRKEDIFVDIIWSIKAEKAKIDHINLKLWEESQGRWLIFGLWRRMTRTSVSPAF